MKKVFLHSAACIFTCCIFLLLAACGKKSFPQYENFNTWAEWSLPVEDGCKLFVREIGRGPRVIVLHGGWGAEHSYMIDGFIPLAHRYRFIFYDQRGSLRSRCDTTITADRHIADLDLLRQALQEDQIMLVGHSMGGYLAMAYASKYPTFVKGIALVAAPPADGTSDLNEKLREPTLKRWEREQVVATLRENGLETKFNSGYTPQQRSLHHRITWAAINLHNVSRWRSLRGSHFYTKKAGQAAAQSMPKSWNFEKLLVSLPFEILVMHGDDDFMPLELHHAWVSETPNVQLEVIEEAGHVIWIDQPNAFIRILGDYLESRTKT